MSIIVKLIRITVKKQLNMLPGCHSACLPADPDTSVFLALLWPAKLELLCTGIWNLATPDIVVFYDIVGPDIVVLYDIVSKIMISLFYDIV